MKRSRAVAHLVEMARECGELRERLVGFGSAAPPVSLWAYGAVLAAPGDWPDGLEFAGGVLTFDVDPHRLPWFGRPPDLEYAAGLTGWSKRPVHLMFRSSRRPVDNHRIVRPLLLWSAELGVDEVALAALTSGEIEPHRAPARSREGLRQLLEAERAVSYAAMAGASATYDEKRWGRGKLSAIAEPLWEATAGYVDLTDAVDRLTDEP